MRMLAINAANMAEVERVTSFASRPENYYDVARDRALKVPGDDERYVARLDSFRCVFSITKTTQGLFRQLTISVPSKRYPNPFIAYTIAQMFGFTGWDGVHVEPPPAWLMNVNKDEHCVMLAQELE